jgi:hypothetical protein
MLYAPPPIFGIEIFRIAPVVVEVLENPASVGSGMARVRVVVPKNALINTLAKIPPNERTERVVERLVIASALKPLENT